MKYLLLFRCKNGCTNAPRCYIIRTLPVFLHIKSTLNTTWHPGVLHILKNYTSILAIKLISCFVSNKKKSWFLLKAKFPRLKKYKQGACPPNCRVCHQHHQHHISVMELGHLLTRSGLAYPEVSSKVCHDSFCQLENNVSLS